MNNKKQIVYIVIEHCDINDVQYEEIVKVFSTYEKADKYIKKIQGDYSFDWYSIESYEVG